MKNNFVPHSPLTTPVLFLIFNRPDTTPLIGLESSGEGKKILKQKGIDWTENHLTAG